MAAAQLQVHLPATRAERPSDDTAPPQIINVWQRVSRPRANSLDCMREGHDGVADELQLVLEVGIVLVQVQVGRAGLLVLLVVRRGGAVLVAAVEVRLPELCSSVTRTPIALVPPPPPVFISLLCVPALLLRRAPFVCF